MSSIEVKKLCKQYGHFKAVDNMSFNVEQGEVLGFLGPNGAGKSTTMKMLSCFISPNSGTAKILGHDILKDSKKVRQSIGYLPENAPLYKEMTVRESLHFIAAVRGLKHNVKKRIAEIIEQTFLTEAADQIADTLSKGYRQRLGFAQALIHDPPILILDEPTDGLDPNQKHEVRELISTMRSKKAILLSTHILEEVSAVCTRALIIKKGQLVANDTPENLLRQSFTYRQLRIELEEPASKNLQKKLQALPEVEKLELSENLQHLSLHPKDKQSLQAKVLDVLRLEKASFHHCIEDPGRFEDIFRKLTFDSAP